MEVARLFYRIQNAERRLVRNDDINPFRNPRLPEPCQPVEFNPVNPYRPTGATRLYFHDDKSGKSKQIILSVKAGENVNVAQVRDLGGVIEREKAEIGVLISMEKASRPMLKEA